MKFHGVIFKPEKLSFFRFFYQEVLLMENMKYFGYFIFFPGAMNEFILDFSTYLLENIIKEDDIILLRLINRLYMNSALKLIFLKYFFVKYFLLGRTTFLLGFLSIGLPYELIINLLLSNFLYADCEVFRSFSAG